jgi:hypothetical protein
MAEGGNVRRRAITPRPLRALGPDVDPFFVMVIATVMHAEFIVQVDE